MDVDIYIQKINDIVTLIIDNFECYKGTTPLEPYYIDEKILDEFIKMVEIKKDLITSNERSQAGTGMILCKKIEELDRDSETKIVLTAIYLDVWEEVRGRLFLRSIDKYQENDPIFKNSNLFEYIHSSKELIDFSVLNWGKSDCCCQYNGKYFIPNRYINEEIIQFTKGIPMYNGKFIKLDAHFCSGKRPEVTLQFEAKRPVNPNWLNKLSLFNGQTTGGHYILQEPLFQPDIKPSEEERLKWWEYKMRGVRSLEIYAKRNHNGNLSMMLEEINAHPVCNKYFVSKCIHLDSDDEIGKEFEDAILNHIDLAVNVYTKEVFSERQRQSLADGRVVDASFRTHILRLDGVPFRALVNLSILFFDSQFLTSEWITDQFR